MRPDALTAWLDAYRRSAKDALAQARRDGFAAVQPNVAAGELSPSELSASGRRHLAKLLRDLGLHMPSLALEFPGAGLSDPNFADQRLEQFRETIRLCTDLGVRSAEISLGGVADPKTANIARELLEIAAGEADRSGVEIAVRPVGGEFAELQAAVESLRAPGLGLALHTDQLAPGERPAVEAARLVRVAAFRDGRPRAGSFEETPLGEGTIDLPGTLAALEAGEFHGPIVVRREGGRAAVDGLAADRNYIAALLGGARR
jgi:sugar phosphate isomerase/epimerase